MSKLTLEKREVWMYTDSNGRIQEVTELETRHLLNAYKKAANEKVIGDRESIQLEKVLEEEIIRRIYNSKQNDA